MVSCLKMQLNDQKWNPDTALEKAFRAMVSTDTTFPGDVWWRIVPMNDVVTPHDLQKCVENIPLYGLNLFVRKMIYLHCRENLLIYLQPELLKIFFIAMV